VKEMPPDGGVGGGGSVQVHTTYETEAVK